MFINRGAEYLSHPPLALLNPPLPQAFPGPLFKPPHGMAWQTVKSEYDRVYKFVVKYLDNFCK